MPLVSSVESNFIKDEIKEKVDNNLLEIISRFNINNIFLLIKILIFIDLGLAIPFIIFMIVNFTVYSFEDLFLIILNGLGNFPNSVLNIILKLTAGNFLPLDEWTTHMMLLYVMGILIVLTVEMLDSNFKNYSIGFLYYVIIGYILFLIRI
jgi:hypothetical protein